MWKYAYSAFENKVHQDYRKDIICISNQIDNRCLYHYKYVSIFNNPRRLPSSNNFIRKCLKSSQITPPLYYHNITILCETVDFSECQLYQSNMLISCKFIISRKFVFGCRPVCIFVYNGEAIGDFLVNDELKVVRRDKQLGLWRKVRFHGMFNLSIYMEAAPFYIYSVIGWQLLYNRAWATITVHPLPHCICIGILRVSTHYCAITPRE